MKGVKYIDFPVCIGKHTVCTYQKIVWNYAACWNSASSRMISAAQNIAKALLVINENNICLLSAEPSLIVKKVQKSSLIITKFIVIHC
ncbi:hypothetical protein T08_8806 [Trichinella sp. T8]|nr:hypothetical protein T08_8806 [Trichinella sp. T8]